MLHTDYMLVRQTVLCERYFLHNKSLLQRIALSPSVRQLQRRCFNIRFWGAAAAAACPLHIYCCWRRCIANDCCSTELVHSRASARPLHAPAFSLSYHKLHINNIFHIRASAKCTLQACTTHSAAQAEARTPLRRVWSHCSKTRHITFALCK